MTTEITTYVAIEAGTDTAEAFGVRYSGLSAVQAAKIEAIRTKAVARVRDMRSRVRTADEKPSEDSGRPFGLFGLMSGGCRFDPEEFELDSAALIAGAKLDIEKVAAKADNLVRERAVLN
ncbi:hypothetical protein [Paracoccus versutus]|uniref:hypothetical protein n=1 Tax=Paracoccus versutus TaxID=34007 RepID=UPI0011C07BA7|nr:hypothetical protein [Paracoccus versutus]